MLRGEALDPAMWQPRLSPLDAEYLVPFLAAAVLLVVLPFASEALRSLAIARKRV